MNQQIRIGINCSMLDDHPTGVGVYSYNLVNHLYDLYKKRNDFHITVFTASPGFLNKSLSVKHLPKRLFATTHKKFAAINRFVWNTFKYPLLAKEFDLLISPTTHGSFFSKNQIITIHDLLSLRFGNISRHQRFYFKYLLPLLIKQSKCIVTVSNTTKNDIVSLLGYPEDKVHVIYNGYDDNVYNTKKLESALIAQTYHISNYILAIGPTYAHKNFELLIEAYQMLDESVRQQYPLLIAGGKSDYLNKLKTLVHTLDLDHCIHFIGYVPQHMMPALYKEAFVLVFPSLYEGFGFPLLEAMASGCPVISSNTASMPEVCGDAALYFDPTNKNELKQSILEIIKDGKLRTNNIEKGIERARLFSWSKAALKLDTLIISMTQNNNNAYAI